MGRAGRDILSMLCRDHDQLRMLLERLDKADAAARQTLLVRLRDEMHVHGMVEDEILYPAFGAMLDDEAAERLVAKSRAEHAFIGQLLDEAVRVPGDSVSEGDDLLLARETFERHADHEEDTIFPQMQQACSERFLEDLGVRATQRKEALRRQMRRRRGDAAEKTRGTQRAAGMSKTELIRSLRSK